MAITMRDAERLRKTAICKLCTEMRRFSRYFEHRAVFQNRDYDEHHVRHRP